MRSRIKIGSILLVLLAAACIEQFNPPRESSDFLGYLVIDGYLDGNNGRADVQLNRSVGLTEYKPNPGETEANVQVEGDNGGTFSLKEGKNGLYSAINLTFDKNVKYRVRIQTKNGRNYSSDYIQMRVSPAFDSLVWRAENKGIQFYVNGHDDSGNTKYYQYRFTETWQFSVAFVSHYKNIGGLPVKRNKNELVHDCWDSRISTDVLVKSTTGLNKDQVTMFPIFLINKGARKLLDTYSVLVEQRAISEEEYQFWELIRKTNETLGGLFDPIPSKVLGNVRCDDDSDEPVLGHLSGGYPQQKRIFLHYSDLPQTHREVDPLSYECSVFDYHVGSQEGLGTNIYLDLHTPPSTWFVTSAYCGDCRTVGGDTIRPAYWPQ